MPKRGGFSVDPSLWESLKADPLIPKDDPLLIAKFSLGFTSPRIQSLKLSKHPLYGAFVGLEYSSILEQVAFMFPELAMDL